MKRGPQHVDLRIRQFCEKFFVFIQKCSFLFLFFRPPAIGLGVVYTSPVDESSCGVRPKWVYVNDAEDAPLDSRRSNQGLRG